MDRSVDVVVVGGGVAGLWLLRRLLAEGYDALLLEARALGAGQSIAAQGIIHGGLKYALQGTMTESAREMADIPTRWRACLAGGGEVDLGGVEVLAERHLLWSPGGVLASVAGFFARMATRSRMDVLDRDAWPRVFRDDPAFRGTVYELDEVVVDAPSLMRALADPVRDRVRPVDWPGGVEVTRDGPRVTELRLAQAGEVLVLRPRALVLTAGAGNGPWLERLGLPGAPAQQLRPLHQVMVRPLPFPLYAHCLGASNRPRLTVTSHPLAGGGWVWYLGGVLAEEGVARDLRGQAAATREELAALFPALDLAGLEVAGLRVDRAERASRGGIKPDAPTHDRVGENLVVGWPTKLAFAPRLAGEILATLKGAGIDPGPGGPPLPAPDAPVPVAPAPWEAATAWVALEEASDAA